MFATDRLAEEIAFHDRQADDRAGRFRGEVALRFADEEYLLHESWVAPAFARLGEVRGRRVLDYGCGHGMAAVVLARRGARVTAFDLSAGYLREARRRARANGVAVELVQADGHRLPFAATSFDAVWGNAVLHHLDPTAAAAELRRVLRPGGVAVFCEPWGGNPLLSWARRHLPYPGKQRTRDERPLGVADVAALRAAWPGLHVEGFQLLSMARRLLGRGRVVDALARCDAALLRRMPVLARLCRYVVLTWRKACAASNTQGGSG